MRRNPCYLVKRLETEYYLIPHGQAIERGAPALRISEAAALLWKELGRCGDPSALAARLAECYEAPASELPRLEEDVQALLEQLRRVGAVLDGEENAEVRSLVRARISPATPPAGEKPAFVPKIAGIALRFYGKEMLFAREFLPFCRKENGAAVSAIEALVTTEPVPAWPPLPILLQGPSVTVCDGGTAYILCSSETPALRAACLAKDGSRAALYLDPAAAEEDAAACAFHALRYAFLLRAQQLGMYVIHSASILHEGKAWLFSALSGTGKSTHAALWHRLYGSPYLNGDLNLIAFEDGRPVVKGIPWCGTSGLTTTETYPLGGILLLARSADNRVEALRAEEQCLGIQMRFVTPKWNAVQTAESLDFANHVAHTTRIARLHCNMEDEAAAVCRAWIEEGGHA